LNNPSLVPDSGGKVDESQMNESSKARMEMVDSMNFNSTMQELAGNEDQQKDAEVAKLLAPMFS